MHTVKETDMLAAKLDLLMKRLDERAHEKEAMYGTVKTMDSHMTCEVCMDTQKTTAPRPVKKLPTSTTGSVHKEVITVEQSITSTIQRR